MKKNITAAMLSAFVLPGIGQLYKGCKIKGGILLVLVNLFLIAALFLVLQGMGVLLASSVPGTHVDPSQIVEQLRTGSPAARWILAFFGILWLYAVGDALICKPGQERMPEPEPEANSRG